MKTMNLPLIVGALLLTVLICAGFWLYTEWNLKRFKASLPQAPPAQTVTREMPPAQYEDIPQEDTQTTENVGTVPPRSTVEREDSAPVAAARDAASVAAGTADDAGLGSFLEAFFEETAADTIASGDFTDVGEEIPYDMAIVKAGFDDYNAYLKTDPEYAYQRLEAAFREQYGDDPDVHILVEHIRDSNEGPTPIADAIEFTEAMIRLTSKISPPEALEHLQLHLELLRETQQMALEQGTSAQYQSVMHVGE